MASRPKNSSLFLQFLNDSLIRSSPSIHQWQREKREVSQSSFHCLSKLLRIFQACLVFRPAAFVLAMVPKPRRAEPISASGKAPLVWNQSWHLAGVRINIVVDRSRIEPYHQLSFPLTITSSSSSWESLPASNTRG